jgi:sn-glycerol 3-phosphate transport system ATP-binding protein
MRLEIRKLQKRLGVTSIYVTHDQVEAMTLGDRLMVLNAGRVEQFDTPIALYERPASMFVAGFIGSPAMNFLPATIENGALTLEN